MRNAGLDEAQAGIKIAGRNINNFRYADESESEVTQSCPTLWDPMDCSLPGFSIHGIFQARVLEWVAISFSRVSSWPRDWTWVSRIVGKCITVWATMEVIPYGRKWGRSKEPLGESERGEWKAGLKLNIQKTKIMASGPITSWQIDEETVETVADFISGAPQLLQMVTAAMKLKVANSLEGKLWPS